jgi:hypothetical protein
MTYTFDLQEAEFFARASRPRRLWWAASLVCGVWRELVRIALYGECRCAACRAEAIAEDAARQAQGYRGVGQGDNLAGAVGSTDLFTPLPRAEVRDYSAEFAAFCGDVETVRGRE